MKEKILKLFSKIFSNKKLLILVFGLVLLFSLGPLYFAQANIFSDIATYILTLPLRMLAALVALGFFLLGLVFGFIFFLIGGILGSFISQTLSIKVMPGLDPAAGGISVVNTGWAFSQGLVNILIILILVFIGLATILRIQTWRAQKTLPMLILVALLVNFSGVIVGFVVDIANLITNFFVEKFADFSVENLKEYAWDAPFNYFKNTLIGLFTTFGDIGTVFGIIIGAIVYGLALLIFNIMGVFILLTVLFVFILRVIILWVLAIVAPIAFLTLALPPTPTVKRLFPSILHWDEWWQQLIQWAIVGIPLGFFLVLSKYVFIQGIEFTAPSFINPGLSEWGGAGQGLTTFISNIFGPLIGLVLMGLGVLIAIQTAPSGARGIMEFGKKAGIAAGAWAGRRGLAVAREKVPESWRERMESLSMTKGPEWGKERKGISGWALRRAAGVTGMAQRGIGETARKAVVGGEQAAADKSTEEAKKRDVVGNLNTLRQAGSEAERMGIIKAMMEKKQMRDALDENVVGDKKLTQEEGLAAYKKARQFKDRDATEDMEWSFAHMEGMPEEMAKLVDIETASAKDEKDRTGEAYGRASGLSEDDVKLYGYTSYKDKIIRRAKSTDDFKKFHKGLWAQKDAKESMLYLDRNQITAATTQFGRVFSDNLQGAAEEKMAEHERKTGKRGIEWFYEANPLTGKMRNPRLPKYFQSTAAQGSYIPLEGAEGTNEIKNLESAGRKKQKPYLERDLKTAEAAGNIAEVNRLKGDIAEIERLEKEERRRIVTPPPEKEEPLAVKIKGAKGEEKEILERAFARLPEPLKKTETDISNLDDEIAGLERDKKKVEEEIERRIKIEKVPEEADEIRGLRGELDKIQENRNAAQERRDAQLETWRTSIREWRDAHPEMEAAQEIIRLREMEKLTQRTLGRMKTLGRPRAVIEKTEEDLRRTRDQKTSWEGRMAYSLRKPELNKEIEGVQKNREAKKGELAQAKGKVTQIEEEVANLTRQREEADRELYSLEEKLTTLEADPKIQERETRLKELQAAQKESQEEITEREKRVKELQQQKEDLRKSGLPREQRRSAIRPINQQIDSERASLAPLRTSFDKNQRRIEQLNNELGKLKPQRDEEVKKVQGEIKTNKGRLKDLGGDIRGKNKDLKSGRKEQSGLEKTLENIQKHIDNLQAESETIGRIEGATATKEDEEYLRNLREGAIERVERVAGEWAGKVTKPAGRVGKKAGKTVGRGVKKAAKAVEEAGKKVEKAVKERVSPKRTRRKRRREEIIEEEETKEE